MTSITLAAVISATDPYNVNRGTLNLGPLTTAYSPPANCTSDLYYISTFSYLGWADNLCEPGDYNDILYNHSTPIFSPGNQCPQGMTIDCTYVGTRRANETRMQYWSKISTDETAVGCCPTGYACATNLDQFYYCLSQPTKDAVITVTEVNRTAVDLGVPQHSEVRTIFGYDTVLVTAQKVIYVANPTDLASMDASKAAPGSSNTTPSARQTSAGAASTQGDVQSGGLSTGAKAGLGVGVSLLVIAMCLSAFLLYRHLTKKRAVAAAGGDNEAAAAVAGDGAFRKAELDSEPISAKAAAAAAAPDYKEKDTIDVHQALPSDGQGRRSSFFAEMEAGFEAAELPGEVPASSAVETTSTQQAKITRKPVNDA
ncbi:hypothetical protein VHEMI08974 [[Torrubiella] hemipterigena]|uniref:Uncharacterized protein n=1 Tax=[Torrubiella] hemipterigena TaxID=1531966 RepID=A0A0A1TQN0_9HYPO|nr:hypothetical protein VHEMI08974 [[Torrubiella] hemipterigena]